jgi:hypothetical protein
MWLMENVFGMTRVVSESKNIDLPEPIPICEMDELLEDAPLHSPRKIEILFGHP